MTGSELLSQAAARATTIVNPNGSGGIEHMVVVMMEHRSFDHFLGWLPSASGRTDMIYLATDGNFYPNHPLAPDFQAAGRATRNIAGKGGLSSSTSGRWTAPCSGPRHWISTRA